MKAESNPRKPEPLGHTLDKIVVRQWHGRVHVSRGAEYVALMKSVAIPDYRRIDGNLGAFCLHRREGDTLDVTMVSWWRNYAAIEAFAGADISVAKYYDFDVDFLLELEPHVMHFEADGEVAVFTQDREAHRPQ